MKFVSELTSKVYDTPEACMEADEAYLAEQRKAEEMAKQAEEQENVKKAALSKLKKELADAIIKADADLNRALDNYAAARDRAAELLERSNREVAAILDSAKKEIEDAKEAKQQVLLDFNRKFGPFKVSYTGEKAKQECQRLSRELDFNSMFGSLLNNVFL